MAVDRPALLRSLHGAFAARDIDTVLAAMSPGVDRPNGWQGGRAVGHDAVRRYQEGQWAEIRPHVRPTTSRGRPDGRIEVGVRQVVRDRSGTVLDVSDVRHVHSSDGDLVSRMDVGT